MYEKCNPCHPDKIADRIAGAIVDLCYAKNHDPKVAVEVLIGHGVCHIIVETSEDISEREVSPIVRRIAGNVETDFVCVQQDRILAGNQAKEFRCGDNGIFKGVPVTAEQNKLADIAQTLTFKYPSDGKYVLDGDNLFANVFDYDTGEYKTYEAHRKYIDIQFMVKGEELIGVAPFECEKTETEAIPENDVWFYDCKTEAITLIENSFMVLYPNDLHCPGVATKGEALTCKKVVVKVKV